ncbi:hypothetical protein AUEXF2481DRAFT_40074 [Aureobasidium subglaciale EXF-2481]|uniref:Ketoreductase domain-containing protein n=1 Tax=Aureobasidium subglaciale (strain EXF-2481) TaxID=1043005 RepID=A0A074Z9N9_AURSE|nr:uncharacterized protein AUEXF2481DRAFT_40074 [Aureobasidium subglaciale EXF-2481]KEQ95511.1 hypothetical protein AUEXF2481DRAFT_40074 [Aureobasidium subglaciale EXF-2481]
MSLRIFSPMPSISKTSNLVNTTIRGPPSCFHPVQSSNFHQIRTLKLYASSKHALRRSTCLITGASRGIGRAIAIAFAREGARCILLGRDKASLQVTFNLCTSARGAIGRTHHIIPADINDAEFWSTLDKHACWNHENGRLDTLVNAAGVTHSSLFVRTSQTRVDEVLSTNLSASIQACRFAVKKMLKSSPGTPTAEARRGHILNISSLLATHGGAGSVAYAASKAGVLGLTRSLAAELGPRGIRVNAICPGYVETDMTRAMSDAAREAAVAKIPAARFGTVDEVADAAVFLSGNQYANNTVLNLDGGLSAV